MKCKQFHPGFELSSPVPFPAIITVTLNTCMRAVCVCVCVFEKQSFFDTGFLSNKWRETFVFYIVFLRVQKWNLFKRECMNELSKWLFSPSPFGCPVGEGCRIHQLHLNRGVKKNPPQRVSCYDTKLCDGEIPVILELWGMRSTPSLQLLPGPLWSGWWHLIGSYLWVK